MTYRITSKPHSGSNSSSKNDFFHRIIKSKFVIGVALVLSLISSLSVLVFTNNQIQNSFAALNASLPKGAVANINNGSVCGYAYVPGQTSTGITINFIVENQNGESFPMAGTKVGQVSTSSSSQATQAKPSCNIDQPSETTFLAPLPNNLAMGRYTLTVLAGTTIPGGSGGQAGQAFTKISTTYFNVTSDQNNNPTITDLGAVSDGSNNGLNAQSSSINQTSQTVSNNNQTTQKSQVFNGVSSEASDQIDRDSDCFTTLKNMSTNGRYIVPIEKKNNRLVLKVQATGGCLKTLFVSYANQNGLIYGSRAEIDKMKKDKILVCSSTSCYISTNLAKKYLS